MRFISIDSLSEGMILSDDVYTKDDSLVPLLRKHTILSTSHVHAMKTRGVDKVPVIGEDPELILPTPKALLTPEETEVAIHNLTTLFHAVSQGEEAMSVAPQAIKELDQVVEHMVLTLLSDEATLTNISDLKSYDEYTYHHSLSVSVLSLTIGRSLGFDAKQLRLLGKTSMMHDIGKTAIPIHIINKPSRLTEEEFRLIKEHSPEGYVYLTKSGIGDALLWEGVLHHHEKMNGTGYPYGLSQNGIPLFSKIISVADVYDALTSNRPYREPLQPQEAVEYVMAGVGTDFDYDIVNAFLKKIELYPVGSYIELSDSRIAQVIANENPMRPIIRMADTQEILDLFTDRRSFNIVIKRILPNQVSTPTVVS